MIKQYVNQALPPSQNTNLAKFDVYRKISTSTRQIIIFGIIMKYIVTVYVFDIVYIDIHFLFLGKTL